MPRLNDAEEVAAHLQQYPNSKWGFAIYRCTYDSAADWTRFLQILHSRVEKSLDYYNRRDLLARLDWAVQDDPTTLDGASKDFVRAHFRSWARTAAAGEGTPHHASPRYTYCVHVDAAALDSVVNEAPQPPSPDLGGVGYVNVVNAEWEMPDRETFDYDASGLDPGEDDPTDEGEEEFEGCRLFDVGWMRVCVDGLLPRVWVLLSPGHSGWDVNYVRPPQITIP